MSTHHERVSGLIARLAEHAGPDRWPALAAPLADDPQPRNPQMSQITPELIEMRWSRLGADASQRAEILDAKSLEQSGLYTSNIENFIGTVKVPLGIAGPLRVRGLHARGDFYVPMATTEAALVASCTRGCAAVNDAEGITAAVVSEMVSRSPCFCFATLLNAGQFIAWLTGRIPDIKAAAETTSRFAKLDDLRVMLEGANVYLNFDYHTADAAGQNMVTIATNAACEWIVAQSPVKASRWYVEANHSSDKKASSQSLMGTRGKKVVAEVLLDATTLRRRLHVTAQQMHDYWSTSVVGALLSGTIGVQGHTANTLAAAFIACGQDAACVAESAVGITRLETRDKGSLYASLTLPNVIVGTVGGGTALPSQRACLELLGLAGPGHANALAEVITSLALAGELSIVAAIVSGEFTEAHRALARQRQTR